MRRPALLLALSLVLTATACGGTTDPTGSGGGGSPDEPTASETSSGSAPTDSAASAAVEALTAADLEDFGCGYGFTVGTSDQTVRLSIFDDSGFGDPPTPGSVELGEDGWSGQLVVGRDLFAQWCDDVIEPDEPEVVQDESWAVVGTLTWELVEGDGMCPSIATATLEDATALTASGEVALPDVEFRNESFGCFAG